MKTLLLRVLTYSCFCLPFLAFRGDACRAADSTQKPNIVVIMADDFGYECIGANGGTSYKTPVLDQLAAPNKKAKKAASD